MKNALWSAMVRRPNHFYATEDFHSYVCGDGNRKVRGPLRTSMADQEPIIPRHWDRYDEDAAREGRSIRMLRSLVPSRRRRGEGGKR